MNRPSKYIALKVLALSCLGVMLVASNAMAQQIPPEQIEPEPEQRSADNSNTTYMTDDADRPFRVEFPLHDRITFEAVTQGNFDAGLRDPSFQQGLGLAIRHSFGIDYEEEEIWWRFRHRWLSTAIAATSEGPMLNSTLLRGSYLRHDKSGFVVIPSTMNLRFPAPFDIAVDFTLFDIDFDPNERKFSAIEVADIALLLDFIRDEDYRHRLAIGPVIDYQIERDGSDEDIPWTHSFIPATGGRLLYGWESATGRFAADAQIQCAAEAVLAGDELQWQRRCSAGANLERTIFAVNDRPINLLITSSVGEPPQRLQTEIDLEWSASLGLRLSLPERR